MAGFAVCAHFAVGCFDVFQITALGFGVQFGNGGMKPLFGRFEFIGFFPCYRQRIAVALFVFLKMLERFFALFRKGGGGGFEFFQKPRVGYLGVGMVAEREFI